MKNLTVLSRDPSTPLRYAQDDSVSIRHSSFVIHLLFVIRHSSFC
jgi:hypothetical protein